MASSSPQRFRALAPDSLGFFQLLDIDEYMKEANFYLEIDIIKLNHYIDQSLQNTDKFLNLSVSWTDTDYPRSVNDVLKFVTKIDQCYDIIILPLSLRARLRRVTATV